MSNSWVRAVRVCIAILPFAMVMDYYINVTVPQTLAAYVALLWCYCVWPKEEAK